MDATALRHEIAIAGSAPIRAFLSAAQCAALRDALDAGTRGTRRRAGDTYAVRNILWENAPLVRLLAETGIDGLASAVMERPAFGVQAILFDKNPAANWLVPGHQDVVMPVAEQVEEAGCAGWSVKAGVPHVELPARVLAGLLAVRIHLDGCDADNGALAVVPGSHRRGRLTAAQLAELPLEAFRVHAADLGDLLLMRPLLVHRSSPARQPVHRRVLHIVYAAEEPSGRLRWRRAGGPVSFVTQGATEPPLASIVPVQEPGRGDHERGRRAGIGDASDR